LQSLHALRFDLFSRLIRASGSDFLLRDRYPISAPSLSTGQK